MGRSRLPPLDAEQLAERGGVWTRVVDLHGSCTPDAFLGDQSAPGQAIDLTHHGRGIHLQGPGEVGQGSSFVLVEEQLDEDAALCVASKDRERLNVVHCVQHIMQDTQNK